MRRLSILTFTPVDDGERLVVGRVRRLPNQHLTGGDERVAHPRTQRPRVTRLTRAAILFRDPQQVLLMLQVALHV